MVESSLHTPHFGMVEFFCALQHQIAKIFLLPAKCVKLYPFDGVKGLSEITPSLRRAIFGQNRSPQIENFTKISYLTCGKFAGRGKQDKESATTRFRPSTSGKPAFVFIRNFMVGIGGKYVEALDLCAEKC